MRVSTYALLLVAFGSNSVLAQTCQTGAEPASTYQGNIGDWAIGRWDGRIA
jgi:hypothetical protein